MCIRDRGGGAKSRLASIVENEDVAFTRQAAWDHVDMVLPDDLPDVLKRFACLEIRPQTPDDIARSVINDKGNIKVADIADNVEGVETLSLIHI